MISISMHEATGFYIADVVTHTGGRDFVTREIFFTGDRGDKIRITLFADRDKEHHLDPLIATADFIKHHAI